jgi:transcriptional regulator with XRE-family HTH domain
MSQNSATAIPRTSIDIAVGRRLKLLRLLTNLAIDDLSRCLGVDAQTITQYEAGESRLKPIQITKLADRLQVPLHWFFSGFEDDALELFMAEEIELAARNRTDKDLRFLAQFSELTERLVFGPIENRSRVIAQVRLLVGQRIAAGVAGAKN